MLHRTTAPDELREYVESTPLRRVATPEDPASSRLGESFWEFLPRTVSGSLTSAWHLEAARLDRLGKSRWTLRNDILGAWAMTVVLFAALAVAFGPIVLPYLVLQAIIGLADKSLLVREGDSVRARFRMLESIRQYGLDRLRECGAGEEEAVRRRLRDWCLALVADHERRWFGPDQARLAVLGPYRSAARFEKVLAAGNS